MNIELNNGEFFDRGTLSCQVGFNRVRNRMLDKDPWRQEKYQGHLSDMEINARKAIVQGGEGSLVS